jgi:hypothetical protein
MSNESVDLNNEMKEVAGIGRGLFFFRMQFWLHVFVAEDKTKKAPDMCLVVLSLK